MLKNKLVVIGGSLATGKTMLATTLAQASGFKRISMDEVKGALFDVGGSHDRAWSQEIGRLAWPVFQRLVELRLTRGDSVIAEATFLWPDDHLWLQGLSTRLGVDIFQVWLTCDPAVARERFVARAGRSRHPGHCDKLESVLEEFNQRFFNKTFDPLPLSGRLLIVDTTDSWPDVKTLVDFICAS